MLYDVGVTRNLCGHVLIEACSADEAEKIAYDRYIKQGRELPDMDECDELSIVQKRLASMSPSCPCWNLQICYRTGVRESGGRAVCFMLKMETKSWL